MHKASAAPPAVGCARYVHISCGRHSCLLYRRLPSRQSLRIWKRGRLKKLRHSRPESLRRIWTCIIPIITAQNSAVPLAVVPGTIANLPATDGNLVVPEPGPTDPFG